MGKKSGKFWHFVFCLVGEKMVKKEMKREIKMLFLFYLFFLYSDSESI